MSGSNKLNTTDQWILRFLFGKDWTSPTSIGKAYGAENNKKDLHSAWASPKCKKLVSLGLLERSEKGLYRLVNQEKENSMSVKVASGFFMSSDGTLVDIATLSEKGLYAILDNESPLFAPGVMVCAEKPNQEKKFLGGGAYYHDLFEVKLALNGFVTKQYDGQDGLFFNKVVKHEKDGFVRFDIVEYCSFQTDENSSVAEHRGKLQIAYGYTFDPDEEFDEAEIMRTGAIGDLEDHRSLIDPESDEGRKLLEYAGITTNSYDGQVWGDWECPECGETNSSPESPWEAVCEHCKIAVVLSAVDEHAERKATKKDSE